jgi:hypothetical protein
MYDVYRQLRDPKTVEKLDLELGIHHRVRPSEAGRLWLLITPYASEAARLRVGDAKAQAAQDAAVEEARRATYIPPPPRPVSRVPAPMPAGD